MKISQGTTTVSTKTVQVEFPADEVRELLTRAAQNMMEEDVTLSEFAIKVELGKNGSVVLYAMQQKTEES